MGQSHGGVIHAATGQTHGAGVTDNAGQRHIGKAAEGLLGALFLGLLADHRMEVVRWPMEIGPPCNESTPHPSRSSTSFGPKGYSEAIER